MDGYVSTLLKLIPTEVVAVYITGLALIPDSIPDNQKIVLPIWVFICLIFVILVRSRLTSDSTKRAGPFNIRRGHSWTLMRQAAREPGCTTGW